MQIYPKAAIGLTGTIACGKEAVASLLVEVGLIYFSLSDAVREEASRCGLSKPSRSDLQDLGNDLRRAYGREVLAQRTLARVRDSRAEHAVIDGIRNLYEIDSFRRNTCFLLVAVDAPLEIRFSRLRERQRPGDPETYEDFIEADSRDRGEGEDESGQQVGDCIKNADFSIWNTGSLDDLKTQVQSLLNQMRAVVGSRFSF